MGQARLNLESPSLIYYCCMCQSSHIHTNQGTSCSGFLFDFQISLLTPQQLWRKQSVNVVSTSGNSGSKSSNFFFSKFGFLSFLCFSLTVVCDRLNLKLKLIFFEEEEDRRGEEEAVF